MKSLSKERFKQLVFDIEGERKPKNNCIIKFYAENCSKCETAQKIFDKIESYADGKFDCYIMKIGTDDRLVELFGVTAIPSFVFINKEGEIKTVNRTMVSAGFYTIIDEMFK